MSKVDIDSARSYPNGLPEHEQPDWIQDFPTDVPQDDHVARREFTKFLVLTSGAFACGQCWIGLESIREVHGPLDPKPLVPLQELPVGGVVDFHYPTEHDPCLLIRLDADRIVAYSQKCTHLSCAVIPDVRQGLLICPCHHGYFDIAEGRAIAGPPRRPLPRISTEIREGTIYATGVERSTG